MIIKQRNIGSKMANNRVLVLLELEGEDGEEA